jgi:nitroreductase
MDVIDAIKNRRSIRHFKPNDIDEKTVQAVLEAAHWAPSWSNNQCWRFIIVRDTQMKAKISGTLTKIMVDTEMMENAAAESIKQAPLLIVVCAEKGQAGFNTDGTTTTDKGKYWFMFDVALAVENLALAAHAAGLGTCIIGGFDSIEVEHMLGVPNGFAVVAMTPLGFPEIGGQVSPRKKLSDVLYKEKYGNK